MQSLFWRRAFAAILVVFSAAALADDAPVRDHDIEPEDYFKVGLITSSVASPDGELVAYTELRWNPPKGGRKTDLWVVDAATKQNKRLTFERGNDRSPTWSPDGQYIYFSGSRKRAEETKPPYNGKRQVWRISPAGGDLLAITREKDGVSDFELSSDGSTVYYTTSKEEVDEEWENLRSKYSDLEYGHGVTEFSQVFKLDLATWHKEKVLYDKRVIGEMDVSPDQGRIAMITKPDETLLTNEGWSRVDVYDVATKETTVLTPDGWRDDHPSPYGWVNGLDWSADGNVLAFGVGYDGYPSEVYVMEWPDGKASLRKLERPSRVSLNEGTLHWRGSSRDLCLSGDERARTRVYCFESVANGQQGDFTTIADGDIATHAFSFPKSGDPLVITISTTTHPRDVFLVPKPDEYVRLTRVNPQVDTWKLPQISIVSWKGANGDEVEGILELPYDYKPGKPLPMVVELHGGPTTSTLYRLRLWIYGRALMPAKGYALLSPNYHGSTGYGDDFMTALIGRENDIEVEDILTGVDAMIERGIADPDRLGVMGWSNGGFLTNSVITQSDRFKAASSGAGVLDMVIQWGTEDTPGHVVNYMQGLPWDAADAYRKASPIYDLHKVCTPTIIHVGGADARVPAAHSRGLYRALRHYLNVPVELVVYPGEGHGLTKYQSRLAKMEWDLAWFDRYLLGRTGEDSTE
ncbi:MAG: S9 family peptidase [Phycisphaerales bacterium]|nr:MAG: S9 family peptidase [Phycisphaerales bacterium]